MELNGQFFACGRPLKFLVNNGSVSPLVFDDFGIGNTPIALFQQPIIATALVAMCKAFAETSPSELVPLSINNAPALLDVARAEVILGGLPARRLSIALFDYSDSVQIAYALGEFIGAFVPPPLVYNFVYQGAEFLPNNPEYTGFARGWPTQPDVGVYVAGREDIQTYVYYRAGTEQVIVNVGRNFGQADCTLQMQMGGRVLPPMFAAPTNVNGVSVWQGQLSDIVETVPVGTVFNLTATITLGEPG